MVDLYGFHVGNARNGYNLGGPKYLRRYLDPEGFIRPARKNLYFVAGGRLREVIFECPLKNDD